MAVRTIAMAALAALVLAACGPTGGAPSSASVAWAAPPIPPSTQPAALTTSPPAQVGQCAQTTVTEVGTRLENTPGSGSAISYANGVSQVSYDQVPGIDASRAGDSITLCLVSLPQNCPPGDDRGKTYRATNARTGQSWQAPDSEHTCGGA